MAMTLAACLVAAALLLSRAASERRRMIATCPGGRQGALLRFRPGGGGRQLPAEGTVEIPGASLGRHKAFYDQLKATPVPEGSWLVLNDLERQVANTLRPFGAPLPRHADFPNYQEQLDRIRDRRWTVSGRMLAPLKGSIVVALSLRLDGPDGRMKRPLTTILAEARLGAILMIRRCRPAG